VAGVVADGYPADEPGGHDQSGSFDKGEDHRDAGVTLELSMPRP
jgi:hypothetical protein